MIKGQPLVVEAKKVQDRGVQIVDGGDVLLSLPAKQIRCTVCVTALDASTGKPSRKPSGLWSRHWPLEKYAAKLSARRPAYPRAGRVASGRATGPQRVGLAQAVFGILLVQNLVAIPATDPFAAGLVGPIE